MPASLTPDQRLKIAGSIERRGVRETSRRLGTDPGATLRLAAGAPVRNGSMALALLNVHHLDDAAEERAS